MAEELPVGRQVADQPVRRRLGRDVERSLADLDPAALVLVGCSGGADSLTLALLVADMADRGLIRGGAVVVDHQLQPGSADVAAATAATCRAMGLAPVLTIPVEVARGPGSGGLEAAARTARRRALVTAAHSAGAEAILLGHTLDDQAETVLLGLARGSGARSLAAMAPADGLWRRPLLAVPRADVRSVCDRAGLVPYEDPHNADPAFARVRVRATVLAVLEAELGPGITAALARTAELLQADNAALDGWAAAEAEHRLVADLAGSVTIALTADPGGALAVVPKAVRTRLFRLALLAAGCPPGSVTAGHLSEIDRFVSDWRGQGPTRVPGDREVARRSDKLVFYPAGPISG